jgi:hypothetical protein
MENNSENHHRTHNYQDHLEAQQQVEKVRPLFPLSGLSVPKSARVM